uniref:Cytochrome b n=1 Tax=Polycentropus flavomaculatus TaxID=185640 RepID=A0A7D7AFF3_9NEOP|nr:cytochrome b [Polycentropus flavomaculatus]QLY89547.1 cytochrome b [Polycentropus flavomaculatus]
MNKNVKLLNILNNNILKLPIPSNINFLWNFGSLMGISLMIQMISGIMLSMHYSPNVNYSFDLMNHIYRNVNYGWMFRIIHSNGASLFFIFIYMHIGRNIYYESFQNKMTWNSGILLLFLLMATAFLGYVLPWGQMSYWGATVITNLISVIPYIGNTITQWIWGGYSINNATLNRFFSIHFLLPFIIALMVMIHLVFLHEENSNNPLNLNKFLDKIQFNPYFLWKDIMGMIMAIMMFILFSMKQPFLLNDFDNFIESNSMVTPPHIKPEWYFLFAYAILRSIPNKMGGVLALFMSIMILFFIPLNVNSKLIMGNNQFLISKIMFWTLIMIFILLSWIGQNPVEYPFILMGQILSILYFTYFITLNWINKLWNKILI